MSKPEQVQIPMPSSPEHQMALLGEMFMLGFKSSSEGWNGEMMMQARSNARRHAYSEWLANAVMQALRDRLRL